MFVQESELKAVEDHLSFAKEENETLQERALMADAAVSDLYVHNKHMCTRQKGC